MITNTDYETNKKSLLIINNNEFVNTKWFNDEFYDKYNINEELKKIQESLDIYKELFIVLNKDTKKKKYLEQKKLHERKINKLMWMKTRLFLRDDYYMDDLFEQDLLIINDEDITEYLFINPGLNYKKKIIESLNIYKERLTWLSWLKKNHEDIITTSEIEIQDIYKEQTLKHNKVILILR